MKHIQIVGKEDVAKIIQELSSMPMTRSHGKGLVALLPIQSREKPAAIYIRVSSPKQAAQGKGSLTEQLVETWEEIERRNGQIIAVYTDVCTAANRNRLAFNALLEDIRAGKIYLLGCWHSSRLVRTQLAAGELEEAIEKLSHPVEMFAVTDTLDAELLGVLAWAGRWERKAFRERSLMGRQAAVADNRCPSGTPPFWIETVRDETNKIAGYKLKPIAEWVKWMAETYAEGIGSTEIVARLNREGVPRATGHTKYGWTRQYLNQVLKYTALMGKWGPFWGQYIDVPPVVDEITWEKIQQRISENNHNSGRPAKHFVALRGKLWCAECGQKMHAHARDWDYVYTTLSDGTRQRYRIQKTYLKVKYLCGGQQHYGFKCRKPEYVLDKVLFPRVWDKLCQALTNKDLLLAGMESRLKFLENVDELDELSRIEGRLEKLQQREFSYAEQRADGLISKDTHAELMLRLKDEQCELLQVHAQLLDKVKMLEEARHQLDAAHVLVEALPQVLETVERNAQEQLVLALIERIDVGGNNQVAITLRLDPDVIEALSNRLEEASRPHELPSATDSHGELLDNSSEQIHVPHEQKVNAARYKRKMGCRHS